MSIFAPRCAFRLLAARTRRGRWRSGFVFWLSGGIFRFRRAAGRLLTRRRRGWRRILPAGKFGAFFQPGLIFSRLVDDDRSLHSVMTKPAKLATDHFVGSGLDRREPHRNERPGNCVSGNTHMRQAKIVNHIFGGKFDDDRAINRNMQLAQRHNVVFAGRIIWIQPERIRVGDQADVAAAEKTVRSRQMIVPVELLADYVDENHIFGGRKFIHSSRPKRNGESEQKHSLDHDNRKFQMRGDTAAHTVVIGQGTATLAKTDKNEKKKSGPADEERAHEPVTKFEDVIDLVAVLGCVRRVTKKFVDQRQAIHTYPTFHRSPLDVARAASGCGAKY